MKVRKNYLYLMAFLLLGLILAIWIMLQAAWDTSLGKKGTIAQWTGKNMKWAIVALPLLPIAPIPATILLGMAIIGWFNNIYAQVKKQFFKVKEEDSTDEYSDFFADPQQEPDPINPDFGE